MTAAHELPIYSREEVALHTAKSDAWVIIRDKVYNVTNWLDKHPGGVSLILNLAGKDCSVEFNSFHLNPNYDRLKPYLIGQLPAAQWHKDTQLGKDLKALFEELKNLKAFESDYWLYIKLASIISSLFVASIFFLHFSSSYWSLCLSAMFLGLFWQQLAFVGHDLGHHAVTHNKKKDETLGYIFGNFLQGISVAWWRHSHNTHHTLTNSINHDPDIQHLPVLAVSKSYFNNIFSTYYHRVLKFDRIAHLFVSIQHYMFFPIMGLARFNLYAQSFIFNLIGVGASSKGKQAELFSLLGFWTWFLLLLMYISSTLSYSHAIIFLFLSHATAGLVHIQICISHFSMETYMGVPQSNYENDGYFLSQLMTTMNVDCPPWMDLFHGGLQFQIEHHIFPHLTRSKLRYVQGRLQSLCKKHGLPHHSKPFFGAVLAVVEKLHETSKELKLSNMIWDGMNLVG
ncbi:uncharacterized protein LOC100210913 [Hydra vulgaris]|uniref:Fatty acid desaturase 2 n=1 Tax=Hydra vulgaris TaxID=6087 RepID=T2MI66_HYDVU|nr:delta(8)-fatty-acid desaturase 2 [Hydra vulgaris]